MTVDVFHTTNCAFCKIEMEWLDRNHIQYNHHNIEEDDSAREYMQSLGFQGVPVTIITKGNEPTIIQGFDRHKLADILIGKIN